MLESNGQLNQRVVGWWNFQLGNPNIVCTMDKSSMVGVYKMKELEGIQYKVLEMMDWMVENPK